MARILIVDDDPKICQFLSEMVKDLKHEASVANTLEDALKMAKTEHCDLVLLDLEFPEGNGLDILPDLLEASSKPEVIIVTGTGGIGGAELAFKYGAWDYIEKPFILHEISLPIVRALQYRLEKEIAKTPFTLKRGEIIGSSPAIGNSLKAVSRASVTDASVLISGETGTGKELFARAIHENSKRSSENFIVVDCTALPESLAESILFGREKGAYTGAERRQEGLVVQAEGGTLFLDEIGELPFNTQKILLRCLQERRFRPLGAKQEVAVDFRLVAATNRDLEELSKENGFREDLLYRIRAIEIRLPSLRDRGEDVQEIAIKKIHQLSQQYGIATKGVSRGFFEILNAQRWPGNVRELTNVIEYALASAGKDPTLFPKHLPPEYRAAMLKADWLQSEKEEAAPKDTPDTDMEFPTLSEHREKTERRYLQMLLEKAGGEREKACRLSGISQSRLYGLLKKYNLPRFNV